MIDRYFLYLFRKIRLSNPWNYKIPFLIGVPYFMLLISDVGIAEGAVALMYALLTIVGFSSFGYFVLDLADRSEEFRIAAQDPSARLPKWQILTLLIVLLAIALLPWVLYLPLNTITLSLLGAELLIFSLYTFRAFRFKETGLPGVIANTIYSYSIPAALAAFTFHDLFDPLYGYWNEFWIGLVVWQSFMGFRNILIHQTKEYHDDISKGISTFVNRFGLRGSRKVLYYVVVPLEILSLGYFFYILGETNSFFYWIYPIFLASAIIRIVFILGMNPPVELKQILYDFVDDFIHEWFAPCILLLLCYEDISYLSILLIHVVIFRNFIMKIGQDLAHFLS